MRINNFVLGLAIGVLTVGGVSAARAYITRQKTLGASTISTGTLDLTVTPQSALFNFSDIAPGFDSGEQTVNVENSGTIDLKYSVSANAVSEGDNNDLFKKLTVEVYEYDKDDNLVKSIYKGEGKLLKDLQNLEIEETVPAGQARKLGFKVGLPAEVGNEASDLTTNFEIVFYAIQTDGAF